MTSSGTTEKAVTLGKVGGMRARGVLEFQICARVSYGTQGSSDVIQLISRGDNGEVTPIHSLVELSEGASKTSNRYPIENLLLDRVIST